MWLKLDIDGINLEFNIEQYRKSNENNCSDEWCNVKLNIQSGTWLNYSLSGSLLLACEVEEMLSLLEDLVDDKITEPKEIEFIEPDLKFVLNPKRDLKYKSEYIYVKEGYEIEDINTEFKVTFWNGCPTDNYLSTCMNREMILDFIIYLKVITNQISEADKYVQALLKKGTIFSRRS